MILNINFRIEKKPCYQQFEYSFFFIFYTIFIQFSFGNNH